MEEKRREPWKWAQSLTNGKRNEIGECLDFKLYEAARVMFR